MAKTCPCCGQTIKLPTMVLSCLGCGRDERFEYDMGSEQGLSEMVERCGTFKCKSCLADEAARAALGEK